MSKKAIIEMIVRKATTKEIIFIARLENINVMLIYKWRANITNEKSQERKFAAFALNSHCSHYVYNFKAKRESSKDSAQARDVFVAGIFHLASAGRGSGYGKISGAF
jgi:hypothetical protein